MSTTAAIAEEPRPSLTRQASWLIFAKVVGFALSFAVPLLLVRALTRHDFGLYKQAFLIVSTAMTVLPLGFGMTAYYFLPREPERRGAVVAHVLLVYSVVGLLGAGALSLWPDLVGRAFGSEELANYSRLLGAVVFTWTLGSFLEIIPVARGDVRASTIFIVASQASKALFFVAAALSLGTVSGLLYAALAQGVVQVGVLLVYLQSAVPGYWRAFDWKFLRHQSSYAVPLGVSALLLRFQLDLPHYFVAHHFGSSVYALYAVGVLNLPLIGLLRESVGSVMLPRVSQLESQQNSRLILELVARASRKLALVYFPVYAFLMVAGREFIAVLFTRQYLDSWPIFAIYLTLLPPGVLVLDPITRAFASQRHFVLKLRIGILLATAAILWLGTAALGPIGVVLMVVGLQLVAIVVSAWKLWTVIGATASDLPLFGGLVRIALVAGLAALACFATKQVILPAGPAPVLASCALAYCVAYVALLLGSGALAADEWALLRRLTPLRSQRPQGSW